MAWSSRPLWTQGAVQPSPRKRCIETVIRTAGRLVKMVIFFSFEFYICLLLRHKFDLSCYNLQCRGRELQTNFYCLRTKILPLDFSTSVVAGYILLQNFSSRCRTATHRGGGGAVSSAPHPRHLIVFDDWEKISKKGLRCYTISLILYFQNNTTHTFFIQTSKKAQTKN